MGNKRKNNEEDRYPSKHSPQSGDSDTDDLNENEIDRFAVSQNVVSQSSSMHSATQCGVIESVNVKQFMCHTHMDVKFCPKVNFVIGKNGSGKSAILTAVVIGLGGTASNTSRGANIKSFIQQGKQIAEINVRLNNSGQEAYKPEVYGKSLTIQRVIRTSGASNYNIKNSNGKVVSNHKSELNLILEFFNIQVDNPISILNQELSRQFLRIEDAKNKYKLFMRATQLEQISRDYNWTDQNRRLAREHLDKKKQALPHLARELEKWKSKYDYIMSLDDLKSKKEKLTHEFAWAQVVALEMELEVETNKVNVLKCRQEQLDKCVSEYEAKEAKTKAEYEEILSKIEAAELEVKHMALERQRKSLAIKDMKKEVQRFRMNVTSLANTIQNTNRDRDDLIARIEELKSVESNQVAAEKESRLLEISELESKMAELESRNLTSKNHAEQIKHTLNQFSTELRNLKNDDRALQDDLQAARRKLQQAETVRGNRLKRFGQWVPEALTAIEEAYRRGVFKQKPRGPLGLHVKVRDPKWNLVVETYIKPLLFAFVCDNNNDVKVLEHTISGILNKYRARMPMVITSRFHNQVYNVSSHCVQSSRFPSILDMLDIEDPVVTNCLIDQRAIECVLLIEKLEDAQAAMLHEPPRNCKFAYTSAADQCFPSPNFRCYSAMKRRVEYLQDKEDDTTNLKSEMTDLDKRIQNNRQRIQATQLNFTTNQHEYNRTDKMMMTIRSQISQITKKLNELKSIQDPDPVYSLTLEGDLKLIADQLESYDKEHLEAKRRLQSAQIELTKLEDEYTAIDNEYSSKADEYIIPLKEKRVILKGDLGETESNLKHSKKVQSTAMGTIKVKEDECSKKQADVDRYVGLALNWCERPNKIRDGDDIEREMLQIQKYLDQKNDMHGSKEDVIAMYLQAFKKSESIRQDIKDLEDFLVKIDKLMSVRRFNYNKFRFSVATRVTQHFTSLYHQRNRGTGNIIFDHTKESLTISVQPNDAESSKSQNMRSLSGGERSFSTVAFILALWEAIDSPFRMLDEFDVFMDMVNRRLSMGILLDFAKAHPFNQFVFLTPLEMTELHASDDVRILKMKDPERNQGVLPFTPVNA